MNLYEYVRHPHVRQRQAEGPVKVTDQYNRETAVGRFNTWFALKLTAVVGTMICAYLFAALAFVSLPSALKSGDLIIIVAWIAQTFLQLVLLPVIIVGQNVQAAGADKRAEQTYLDAEAVLQEAQEIQKHLLAQDKVLEDLIEKVKANPAG